MNDCMYEKLKNHIGHNLVCVYYGDKNDPDDICIECEDCDEVLISAETIEFDDDQVEVEMNDPKYDIRCRDDHAGKRKTGKAYRRKMDRLTFNRKKKIGTYVEHACWVDWEEVDGEWMPVGKYIKYPNNSEARRYFKKYSNRKVRRSKDNDISTKGNGYRRKFDYWWTLY